MEIEILIDGGLCIPLVPMNWHKLSRIGCRVVVVEEENTTKAQRHEVDYA
ncbi:hypothetical protein K5X82_17450 [Halosquirtibacter xylanolyticus]|nr:hypothetical protein K5X82_17450 [Prolixibacteraceae bacterium]